MTNIRFTFSWKNLSWKKFREKIYLLQNLVFDSIKYKQFKKALLYQEFLLFSFEVSYIAIKQITQLRLDRKIAGFDNKVINSSGQRKSLFLNIKKNLYRWNSTKIRLVYLVDFLKGNILIYVPSISDRVVHYIWGLVLEPVFNSLFFERQISLSSINNFLFVKYTVILAFITQLQSKNCSVIHFKYRISSCCIPSFTINHFVKMLFFPELYKKCVINSFKTRHLLNFQIHNENLHFYLNSYYYYLVFFGIWSLKHIFAKKVHSQLLAFLNPKVFSLYYFTEFLFFLKKDQTQKLYFNVITKLISENNYLSRIFIITDLNSNLVLDLLDWRLIGLNKYNCKIFPSKLKWLEEKTQCRRILKATNFTVYQRIKLVQVFIQTRFFTNWFCADIFIKKHLKILNSNLNKKIMKWSSFLKYERIYISRKTYRLF